MPTDEEQRLGIDRGELVANQVPEVGEEVDHLALAEIVRRLVDTYRPIAIYLFGSRARGDNRPSSDYDLLLVLPNVHPGNFTAASRRMSVCAG